MADLSALNPSQVAAVEHGEGPALVIAGPGSGKTRVVAHRIARLVESGVPARNILAITFTNKAADEMRSRVEGLLGEAGDRTAKNLWMGTFHSMCAKILRQHADKVGFTKDFHIYDETDALNALIDVCENAGIQRRIEARDAAKKLAPEISRIKSEAGRSSDMRNDAFVLKTDKGEEIRASDLFDDYNAYLSIHDAMDFDDLLLNALKLFRSSDDVLMSYQQRFRYVFIDEYQDTNRVQNDLVLLLASPQNNIFAVGDPDQSIYKFRGARIENITEFKLSFSDVELFNMGENYRSVPEIVETASMLIANNPQVFDRSLASQREPIGSSPSIEFKILRDSFRECEWIASVIDTQIAEGRRYSDFVVLYRMHRLHPLLEQSLVKRRIPYKIHSSSGSFFERADIRDCLAMMRCASGAPDLLAVKRAARKTAKGLGTQSVAKLEKHAEAKNIPISECLMKPEEAGVTGKPAVAARKFGSMILEASEAMRMQGPAAALDVFMEDYPTGSDDAEERKESDARIEQFRVLVSVYNSYEEMRDDLVLFASEFAVDDIEEDSSDNFVSLMTYHASKGLEFPVVFLMAMEENIMLPDWSVTSDEDIEEARRLVYVGVTRAEERLYVTASEEREKDYKGKQTSPLSRFWYELRRS